VQIGLSNGYTADQCVPMIINVVPPCRQWDDHYRLMAGADRSAGAPVPRGVALMESAEFDSVGAVAEGDSGGNAVHTGD
jgi:hypothetical protein